MASAIRVENLGKSYQVAHNEQHRGYRTMRDAITEAARAPFRRFRKRDVAPPETTFWALNDISFDVEPGQVVGIIGRNGAGKSTLLKVLSRITKPTRGRVELNGRIGSLLEVGTGFHPELTGRENIYLNGSILGMSRHEIARKFNEIVAFAEIERFLDTPVKRYSSGMYVRLAFSVAAHLEPEILIIDEVLAVGDAVFQRRCLDRMAELARSGLALLFVSHNLDIIPRFCQKALLLDRGVLIEQGNVTTVLESYRESLHRQIGATDLSDKRRLGNGKARFVSLQFLDRDGDDANVIQAREDLRCVVTIESSQAMTDVSLAIVIKTIEGARVISSWTEEVGYRLALTPGTQRFECRFKSVPLRPGRPMTFDIWMNDGDLVDLIENAGVLDVVEEKPLGFSNRVDQGIALCDYEWSSPDRA